MLARSEWGQAARQFGARQRPRRFDLAIDLSEDFFSRRWWRGFATLTALTVATALLAPPFEPLPGGHPAAVGEAEEAQFAAAGVGSLIEGSEVGIAMAPTRAVEPIANAPERVTVDLFARLAPGETIARMLVRLGARYADAGQAQALIGATAIPPGTAIEVTLGRREDGVRPVQRVALRAGLDAELAIVASPTGLRLERQGIAIDATPLRVRGRVGDGLYWSLRAAGVGADAAEDNVVARAGRSDRVRRAERRILGRDVVRDRLVHVHDAVVAENDVVAGARMDGVVRGAAEDDVVPGATVDDVVAADRRIGRRDRNDGAR